jgi:hypothetical protein
MLGVLTPGNLFVRRKRRDGHVPSRAYPSSGNNKEIDNGTQAGNAR